MTRKTTPRNTGRTAAPSLDGLMGKQPSRSTAVLLADIAALTALAGQSEHPGAAEKALSWCAIAARRRLDASGSCLLDFYTANAWICRQHEQEKTAGMAWEQPAAEKAIYHLRKALDNPAFLFFDESLRGRILTLLGNQYSYMGDFIHAIACWDRALETDSQSGMALGNRGKSIAEYAELLAGESLKPFFLEAARQDLEAAIGDDARYYGDEQGKEYFRAELEKIQASLPAADTGTPLPPAVRSEKTRKTFRKWCLSEKLYLNPYNDLCRTNDAACDIMEQHIPDAPSFPGTPSALRFLSQIRREFSAIRHLCHEALAEKALREAVPGQDAWFIAVEKLKLSYRAAWALLPKIARAVNTCFALNLPESRANLKTVWYKNGNPVEGLANVFSESANWPLRGLFWLSKSLPPERHSPSLDPDSPLLKTIADELEMRYLRIVELDTPGNQIIDGTLSRRSLENATLKLLGLVRGAIVYLTQAILIEETRKKS